MVVVVVVVVSVHSVVFVAMFAAKSRTTNGKTVISRGLTNAVTTAVTITNKLIYKNVIILALSY